MTTINSYSVTLGLNASDYIRNSSLSRSETRQLRQTIEQSRSPADKYAKNLNLLSKAYSEGAISARTYNALVERQTSIMNSATVATGGHSSSVMALGRSMLTTVAIAHTLRESISAEAQFSATRAQYEAMVGDGERVNEMLQDMKQFAAETPLSFDGMARAGRLLLNFGHSTELVVGDLKALAEVAGGDNNRFQSLALAFGQIQANGKLMGGELRQLVEAGFNPLKAMAEETGLSIAELRENMSNGIITFDDVRDSLLTAAGGGERLKAMSETTAGALGAMGDQLQSIKIELGGAISPLTKEIALTFSEMREEIGQSVELVGLLASGLSEIVRLGKDAAAIADGFGVNLNAGLNSLVQFEISLLVFRMPCFLTCLLEVSLILTLKLLGW